MVQEPNRNGRKESIRYRIRSNTAEPQELWTARTAPRTELNEGSNSSTLVPKVCFLKAQTKANAAASLQNENRFGKLAGLLTRSPEKK